ncbi:MAG: four helix bundle protein [Gammaproteobacteria bacterium]|nr:four helix bundle protein [Gammaproteobacteria bacterium]
MATHRELEVWNRAVEFATYTYAITRLYPKEETYGLVSQMRRAAVSIVANIAEGAARNSNKEFLRFLYIARGSSSELDALLELSQRTEMHEKQELKEAQEQNLIVGKMLTSLIQRLDNQ